jgi:demethylmenaquinone methyltransferase/2-methoxy-6-polyprenyl-1,4-benzoquinol methylase
LDLSPDNLHAAGRLAAESPRARNLRFVEGDLWSLPFSDRTLDWVWCADTLWPLPPDFDPLTGLIELARVVRPGGVVALVYWSGQSLLCGHPVLEARLAPAFVKVVPYLNDVPPRRHFLRAHGWMPAAGLEVHRVRTFVAEAQAPLSPSLCEGLTHCLAMLWGSLEPHLSPDDWRTLQHLIDPRSQDFVLDLPDYYGFVTYTMIVGRVPS